MPRVTASLRSEPERISNLSVIVFAGFETTTGLLSTGIRELLKHSDQWCYLRDSLVAGPEIELDGQTVSDVDLRWYRWAVREPREADPARRERIAEFLAKSAPLRTRFDAIDRQESSLEAAVEEMLRWSAPGSIIPLTASQDVEVPVPRAMVVRGEQLQAGDKLRIARGETIIVGVDEINRRYPSGPGKFDTNGEGRFDISRFENTKHLSFGVKHLCIGATLARENAKRALEGILRRFPDLEPNGTPIPQDTELFNGLSSLPVRSAALSKQ
jgi:cytochrome P450